MTVYSKNGKEIPLRPGMIINSGYFREYGEEFKTITEPMVVIKTKKEFDGLCQAWEGGEFVLKPLK